MNVFVLCTGRCGSTTFIKACQHIDNYTAAHQSNSSVVGPARLRFPENHIEADNRLAWFLGRLDHEYGDRAFYVHLIRGQRETALSFRKRFGWGITAAYYPGIITQNRELEGLYQRLLPEAEQQVCEDLWLTVNKNIELFLKDKTNKIRIEPEHAEIQFKRFWQEIEATGDLQAALKEWRVKYNANDPQPGPYTLRDDVLSTRDVISKLSRIMRKFPRFVRDA